MKKKDRTQYLIFLEEMEVYGVLKNKSTEQEKEFNKILHELIKMAENKEMKKKLIKLENIVHFFNRALKQDYFTYGIIGERTREIMGDINEF